MYHVGSKDERRGRTGFAHLFEHLLFQGSDHVARDGHFRMIQDAGGTLNGSTWFDRTNYFETVPANELDLALWLESDRMGFFKGGITQEKLDNQRDVVKNERLQSYENRPYGLAFETVLATGFADGHPYRHPTIGYMEDLDKASLEDVHEFFDLHYGPNNAVLVLAGDIDLLRALARVDHWFGGIPPRETPPRVEVPSPLGRGESRTTLPDRVHVPRVYLMYHSPSFNNPDLTESVGMLFVVATARPGVSPEQLEAAIHGELDRLLAEGVRTGELEGALNRARLALVAELNGVGDRADALAHAATLRGEPEYVNEAFARYAAVRQEDVERIAESVIRTDRLTAVSVVPEDSEEPGGRS
jgi:zinc protease